MKTYRELMTEAMSKDATKALDKSIEFVKSKLADFEYNVSLKNDVMTVDGDDDEFPFHEIVQETLEKHLSPGGKIKRDFIKSVIKSIKGTKVTIDFGKYRKSLNKSHIRKRI